jgi:predicted HicB family RNase H-like nuclease
MVWDKEKETKYKNNFIKESYDRINLITPKGKKEIIKEHAANHGESLNGFINRAINEAIERDNSR